LERVNPLLGALLPPIRVSLPERLDRLLRDGRGGLGGGFRIGAAHLHESLELRGVVGLDGLAPGLRDVRGAPEEITFTPVRS
jgi:hypothetical protein